VSFLSPGISVDAFYIQGRGKIFPTKGQLPQLGFPSGPTFEIQGRQNGGRLSSVPKSSSQPISMLELPVTCLLSRQAIASRGDSKNLTIPQFHVRTLQGSLWAQRTAELSEICGTNNVDIVMLCEVRSLSTDIKGYASVPLSSKLATNVRSSLTKSISLKASQFP
jgi:hypothetical protein